MAILYNKFLNKTRKKAFFVNLSYFDFHIIKSIAEIAKFPIPIIKPILFPAQKPRTAEAKKMIAAARKSGDLSKMGKLMDVTIDILSGMNCKK